MEKSVVQLSKDLLSWSESRGFGQFWNQTDRREAEFRMKRDEDDRQRSLRVLEEQMTVVLVESDQIDELIRQNKENNRYQ